MRAGSDAIQELENMSTPCGGYWCHLMVTIIASNCITLYLCVFKIQQEISQSWVTQQNEFQATAEHQTKGRKSQYTHLQPYIIFVGHYCKHIHVTLHADICGFNALQTARQKVASCTTVIQHRKKIGHGSMFYPHAATQVKAAEPTKSKLLTRHAVSFFSWNSLQTAIWHCSF